MRLLLFLFFISTLAQASTEKLKADALRIGTGSGGSIEINLSLIHI